MSTALPEAAPARDPGLAQAFAALGDPTRLDLVARLHERSGRSISELASGTPLTRQAVTKHLRVLEGAGLVEARREGRVARYEIRRERFDDIGAFLRVVSRQWDDALGRLESHLSCDDLSNG